MGCDEKQLIDEELRSTGWVDFLHNPEQGDYLFEKKINFKTVLTVF